MAYNRAGVQEFIAKRGHTGTADVDIWFGGRHQSAELYIKSSGAAVMPLKMIPPVIEDITMTTEHDPPAATTVTHTGAEESLVIFSSLVSGIRVTFDSNAGAVDFVVRHVGRP